MHSFLTATMYFVKSRARMQTLEQLANHWCFWNLPRVQDAYLVDLFPECDGMRIAVEADIRHGWELPYGERVVMAGIVGVKQPKLAFEFGTYTGSTTTLISNAMKPGGIVHTLDLPAEALPPGVDDAIGRCFRGDARFSGHIVQHRADSRVFDYSQFAGAVDLVYIDGSHKFDDVLSDSRNALNMLAPGGVIVWDDYQPSCAPVVEALDALSSELPLRRVTQTRLVVYAAPSNG